MQAVHTLSSTVLVSMCNYDGVVVSTGILEPASEIARQANA